MDLEFTIITVLADVAFGGMAWRLARSLEANQKVISEVLRELTGRVERLEDRERNKGVGYLHPRVGA